MVGVIRTRDTRWTVQTLTPAGWVTVHRGTSFAHAVRAYIEHAGARLLRDGRVLNTQADQADIFQEV